MSNDGNRPIPFSRRQFVGGAIASAAGLLLPQRLWSAPEQKAPADARKGLRFAHLTDIHVQPERRAAEGMQRCLHAVETLDPKPDFILTGGDLVYDVMGQGFDRSKQLFELYQQTLKDHTSLMAYPCVGNHDVFGWSLAKGVTPEHQQYGKKLIKDELGMERTYYKFDRNGWRFYVLDSIQPIDHPRFRYKAGFDDVQFDWLKADLAAKNPDMPAVVVTHIPILSVTGIRDHPQVFKDGYYRVGGTWMFVGAASLTKLFAKHNVRLVLSGHMHEIDRIEFGGVTFICDGAVCGGWWRGPNVDNVVETQEGFGIVDLQPDGSFAHQYHDYGWNVDGEA